MSKVRAVPEGMHTVTVSMSVEGASDAIAFYKKAFGAEEVMRAPDPSGKKIWHAQIRLGDSNLFVNDVFPESGMGGANVTRLWLYVESADAAFKRATDAGCTVKMPLSDMFWGDRLGTVVDAWKNEWTLAQHTRDMTPEDMKKAQDAFVASMKK